MRPVHYNNALRPWENAVTPCGTGKGARILATTDLAKVTCKRCLRMIGGTVIRKDKGVFCIDGIKAGERSE